MLLDTHTYTSTQWRWRSCTTRIIVRRLDLCWKCALQKFVFFFPLLHLDKHWVQCLPFCHFFFFEITYVVFCIHTVALSFLLFFFCIFVVVFLYSPLCVAVIYLLFAGPTDLQYKYFLSCYVFVFYFFNQKVPSLF